MRLDEETLRTLLREEADTVRPAGDGLSRIQGRVARRRLRLRWMRPALAAVAAGALFAAGTVTYGQLTGDDSQSIRQLPAGSGTPTPDASTPEPQPTSTPSAEPVSSGVPVVWPAGSRFTEPDQAALAFIQQHLGMTQLDRVTSTLVDGQQADIGIGRRLPSESRQVVTATVVHLEQRDGGWYVQSASANQLSITDPKPGDRLSATSTVRGVITGVDEVLTVSVFANDKDSPLGSNHMGIGGDNSPWSIDLSFTPPSRTAPVALVAWTDSALDGAPARVTVTPVVTGGSVGQPLAYPSTFYAARNGGIAQLSSQDGSVVRVLTTQQHGGLDSDPQVVGDQVYFLRSTAACGGTLMSIPTADGTPQVVFQPPSEPIAGYSVSPDGRYLALIFESCGDSAGHQQLMVIDQQTGTRHATEVYGEPPMVLGNPSWSPDGQRLAAVVRTGNQAGVRVWQPFALTSVTDGDAWCGDDPNVIGLPQRVAYRPDGALLVATLDGEGVNILSCTSSSATAVFAIADAHAVTGLDATNDAVIIGTGDSDIAIQSGDLVVSRSTGQSPTW